jgi:hypothetical protein
MFVVGFSFLRVYNNWATQTVKKKLEDPNYMPGRDVKLMMPVTQKAKIEAKLSQKRTQYLLDVLSGMAVEIRRLKDDVATIPNKKKAALDAIPPEEVDVAERLFRLQKIMTLDVNGALAKSNAGLTKEALAMMRFKREMGSAAGSQGAPSVTGSMTRGMAVKPGMAVAEAAGAVKTKKTSLDAKKTSFEVDRADSGDEGDNAVDQQSATIFGLPFLTNVFGPSAQVKSEEDEEEGGGSGTGVEGKSKY